VKNFKDLMKINRSTSVINCIDGLKVLSAFWIIMGHRKRYNHFKPEDSFDKLVLLMIGGYHFGVTIFIVCSGVLVTQSFLRAIDRNEMHATRQIISRLVRFSTTIGIVIMVLTSPSFARNSTVFLVKPCKKLLWQTLLMVQNYNHGLLVSLIQALRAHVQPAYAIYCKGACILVLTLNDQQYSSVHQSLLVSVSGLPVVLSDAAHCAAVVQIREKVLWSSRCRCGYSQRSFLFCFRNKVSDFD
jgi:peptidoglycan/LPS O-acetylase OafA/YrhL